VSLVRSFLNGFRRGSDGEIDWEADARTCRMHGRRYDGCPLDMIDVARLERALRPAAPPPARRPVPRAARTQ
jgi:hypothetical protein